MQLHGHVPERSGNRLLHFAVERVGRWIARPEERIVLRNRASDAEELVINVSGPLLLHVWHVNLLECEPFLHVLSQHARGFPYAQDAGLLLSTRKGSTDRDERVQQKPALTHILFTTNSAGVATSGGLKLSEFI